MLILNQFTFKYLKKNTITNTQHKSAPEKYAQENTGEAIMTKSEKLTCLDLGLECKQPFLFQVFWGCCFLTTIHITGDGLVEHRNTAAPSPWVIHILCLLQPVLETVVLCGQSQLLFLQRRHLRPQNSHQHQTSAVQCHQKVLRTRGRGAELGFKQFGV